MMKIGLVVQIVALCACLVSAQDREYEKTFSLARKYYAAGKYDSTVSVIREYLNKHGKEKSTEHIVPLLMEALVRENSFSYFKKLIGIYERKFPGSNYLPRVLYLDGIVKTKEEEYKKAIISFSDAMSRGLSDALDSLSILNVEKICNDYMTESELDRMSQRGEVNPACAEIIEFYQIKKVSESGQTDRSKALTDQFRKKYPRSRFLYDAKKMQVRSRGSRRNLVQVGVLAPVSGDNADIGKYVVSGVKLAAELYNRQHTPKIELVILDTRGNMIETARRTQELMAGYKTPVIIGPVLSSEAAVAAAMVMQNPDVVMITPTATDDGIAALGRNIFQMNVTLGVLGEKIARYAIENMNIKEFAVITPLTEYGRIVTNNFKDEVSRMKGEVVAEEYFDEGTNDFKQQFESLRKKLAERKWLQMAMDGRPVKGERHKESWLSDSTLDISGLFIPAETDDVIKLAPQVYFYRLRTQLLGSNGWHTNNTILGGKKYVENAIFSTSFETEATSEKWLAFSKLYHERFSENPDRVAAPLGYDAANLIFNALKEGDEDMVADYLQKVKGYQGVSGTISFDNDEGVNSEAAILKISQKKFMRVQ